LSATTDSPNSTATLEWLKTDDYHIASKCGGYAVSRVTATPFVHYIAWRRAPLRELRSVTLPIAANDTERRAATKAMQQVCEAACLEKAGAAGVAA